MAIPARYASHRLPGKPLIDIAGKPMIVRVYESVAGALPDADAIVAVDDERVALRLTQAGVPWVMTDPACESGTDRVAEVGRLRRWGTSDVVINVQGDEPLIPADLLRGFIDFCLEIPDLAMGTVSVPVETHEQVLDRHVVKVVTRGDGTAMTFSRAPIPFDRDSTPSEWRLSRYRRHLGLYAYRHEVLQQLTREPACDLEATERLEQLRALWLGVPIHVLPWEASPPSGIDTAEDLAQARKRFGRAGEKL